jgi:hypothetical protein
VSAPSFALIIGLAYILAGVFGFIGSFALTKLLGGLYLAVGLWGCAAWAGAASAVHYARSIAILFGALALLALSLFLNPALGAFLKLMPLGGQDFWLHAATASLAAYFGFRSMAWNARRGERRVVLADRRHALRLVPYERRRGIADRRFGAGSLASGF